MSTTTPDIVTGDDVSLAVNLKKNGAPFVIDPAATVLAALVSTDHQTAYTAAPVAQSSATPGADWAASLVVVELPPESTQEITHQGLALLEIQVDDDKLKTWFVTVKIVTGQIP